MEKNNWKGWLYLLPAALFLGFFLVYPLVDVFVYSFEEGYNSASQTYFGVGLYNYDYVLHDPYFLQAVKNTFLLVVVTVPLFLEDLAPGKTVEDIRAVYAARYQGPLVTYKQAMDEEGFLSGAGLSGKDTMEITVCGNEERILLLSRYDNLGKGASGAAVQCLNMVLGAEITTGLEL